MDDADPQTTLEALAAAALGCTRCPLHLPGRQTALLTLHPSAILRMPGQAAQEETRAGLVADLKAAARLAERKNVLF